MNDWSEDNFLERLTPQLRQKLRGPNGPCPGAETLCAVIEGEARQPERDTVTAHLSQCAACADLQRRLLNFERESPPEPEVVWNQTRTRLDNWLQGFLRSEAARSLSPKRGGPSRGVFGWESFYNFLTSSKIVWALSGALVLVLIVDGVLFLKYRREQLPQLQVAAHPTAPPKHPAHGPETPMIGPQEGGFPTAKNKLPFRAQSPHGSGAGEPGAPTAPAIPLAHANPNLPGQMTQATPAPPPSPALPPARPANNPPAVSAIPAPAEKGHPSIRPVPREPATAAATSNLPRLWLDPANRLFMVVSSIHIKPDGSFQFHGILLLPVSQPGPVRLDRGTEVIGVGTISQGRTSLAVTDLVVQGVRYALKEGSGEMIAETPGSGGGIHFDRSQVLDMWPADTAVYEKVSNPSGQPEPQK